MRKNKEKEQQNKNKISSLILTLVILSFLFLIFFVLILSLIGFLPKEGLINFNEEIQNVFRISRNKFIIEKEECVNETYQIGYFCGFSYKFNNLNDTMTINFTLKPEPLNKDSLLKSQEECRRIEQEAYINSMSLEYPYTLETWVNPIYETKCEKVEVKEIEIIDESNQIYKECVETFTELRDRYSKYTSKSTEEFVKEDCAKYQYDKVNKKDLTKEFLENPDNCECVKTTSDGATTTEIVEGRVFVTKLKCQKYKCFENYYVKVN